MASQDYYNQPQSQPQNNQQYGQQPQYQMQQPQLYPQEEPKYGQPPPNYGQNFQTSGGGKQSFEQTFKVERPKWNDLWAGILVSSYLYENEGELTL